MKSTLLILFLMTSSIGTAAAQSAASELEQLTAENNSTEQQFDKSKSEKSWNSTSRYNSGDRLVCKSNRGQRTHCRADTSAGVRLVNQIGFNTCQGKWGYDYYGIWVVNGCHGEFQIDRYQNHYGQSDDVIRCESYNFRRQTCANNLQGADVQMIHQLSHRSCNGNWGFNQNEVWVANGCKADFLISRNQYNDHDDGYGYGSDNRAEILECRSSGSRIEHCQVPDLQSVELIEEMGRSYRDSCRGNWGYSSNGIWVRRGCHAKFKVVAYQQNNNSHNNQSRELVCESNYNQVRTCRANITGRVDLVETLSNVNCRNRWGYNASGVWVKDGCRARFVINSERTYNPQSSRESFNIECKSTRRNLKVCDTNGHFRDVKLNRQLSSNRYPCKDNWAVNSKGVLYVTNNCHAEFTVYK